MIYRSGVQETKNIDDQLIGEDTKVATHCGMWWYGILTLSNEQTIRKELSDEREVRHILRTAGMQRDDLVPAASLLLYAGTQ